MNKTDFILTTIELFVAGWFVTTALLSSYNDFHPSKYDELSFPKEQQIDRQKQIRWLIQKFAITIGVGLSVIYFVQKGGFSILLDH